MIHHSRPADFKPLFEISLTFAEDNSGQILLMWRQPWDSEGGLWDVPGGGIDPGETMIESALREFKEESGIRLSEKDVKHFKTVYVQKPGRDFVMHLYYTSFRGRPEVMLNPEEHGEFKWMAPEEAKKLPLLTDGAETIDLFLEWKHLSH